MGIGVFMTSWLMLDAHWPYVPAAITGVLTVIPVGVVLAWPALRLRGLELTVLTLAVSLAASAVLFDPLAPLNFSTQGAPLPGVPSVLGWRLSTATRSFEFLVILAVCALTGSAWIARSGIGMTWKAMRAGRAAAAASGIPLVRMQVIGFAISAALAGLSGVMLLTFQGDMTGDAFSATQSIFLVVVVAAFTTGRHAYPALGGLVVGLGSQLFTAFGVTGDWITAIFGIFVVVQILVLARTDSSAGGRDG
jgi:ABC-type branched-subunit amino acid transport system permease subunit